MPYRSYSFVTGVCLDRATLREEEIMGLVFVMTAEKKRRSCDGALKALMKRNLHTSWQRLILTEKRSIPRPDGMVALRGVRDEK